MDNSFTNKKAPHRQLKAKIETIIAISVTKRGNYNLSRSQHKTVAK